MVEPAEHLEELLAERDPDDRHRQPPELDWTAEDAAEHLGRLVVGQLAAGDFELGADELLRTVEGERDELADVVGRDRLIQLVGPQRVDQPPPQQPFLDRRDVAVLHK